MLTSKSGKISKTKLEAWCKTNGWPEPDYEAYGYKVCAYFWKNPSGMSRSQMEAKLVSLGAKVNPEWREGKGGTEVTNISYFKAAH